MPEQLPFHPDTAAIWVTDAVMDYIQSPANNLGMPGRDDPAFGLPLLGFAAGDDPLWAAYKEHIGPFHWTPVESFAMAYPELRIVPEELSVISWILPQTPATCAEHLEYAKLPEKERIMPSERWARARVLGEARVNAGLLRYMLERLRMEGITAVAPALLPAWSNVDSEKFSFASTWSERHAAYAAGLGTFGLCDGLITPVGKAMRTAAVVARLRLAPTPRPYTDHREYCLFFNSGSCTQCIARCPVGALSKSGHDKAACRAFIRSTIPHLKHRWNLDGYGCGFCQVGVPCEKGIPRIRSV